MDTIQFLGTLLVIIITGSGGAYVLYKGYEDGDGETVWCGVIILLIFLASMYYLVRKH